MLDRSVSFPTATVGLAHDFRNLLQMATAAINIIDRGTPERSQRVEQAISGARASLARAGELAQRSLEESSGRLRVADVINVSEALERVRAIIADANGSGVSVNVHIEGDVQPVVGDRLGFENALLNLAFNAMRAIDAKGSINLWARPTDEPSMIEVGVSDDGVGMSAQTLARAFDPYFTTRQERVGGIGLASVQNFVRRVGGTISVESEPDEGTNVIISLPREPVSLGLDPTAL